MIEMLATLSASAAAGIRIAIPLLMIGLLQGNHLWSEIPILSRISSPVLLFSLTIWSLIELFASKKLMGQRMLQLVELLFSPFVGAIMALAVASTTTTPNWLIGLLDWGFVSVSTPASSSWLVLSLAWLTVVGSLSSRYLICGSSLVCN